MRMRHLLLSMLGVIAIMTSAPSAEFTDASFPRGFGVSLSVRSIAEFAIDDFAVACMEAGARRTQ